jgi:hypothetical protein
MSLFEYLMLFVGFSGGVIITGVYYYFPLKKLRNQLYKVKGQVYYWSRQMPVAKKRGRPKKNKSV